MSLSPEDAADVERRKREARELRERYGPIWPWLVAAAAVVLVAFVALYWFSETGGRR